MEALSPIGSLALASTALLLLTLLGLRLRQRAQRRQPAREALDTVAGWPPEAARVMTINERKAYDLLKRAMPGFLVLAQVPLARFVRVPSRHSYADWLARVGSLSADLMLCDAGSRVLAVIDVRTASESERSRRRHERMTRVLRAAGIHVFTWREGELPTPVEVRHALIKIVSPEVAAQAAARPTPSKPMPLIPVPDIAEVLADGDRAALEAHFDPATEPVPSAFLEELEPATRAR
jgi:hypothetical protein